MTAQKEVNFCNFLFLVLICDPSFIFTKLPDNFAITLGNYLRRILLSYVKGISILGVKIGNDKEFIKSEFVSLGGLVETPPYFIMNLKNLVFKFKINKHFIKFRNESENPHPLALVCVLNVNYDKNSFK